MDCHESLMARRRKRKAGGSSGKRPAGPNVKLDKSLPSLPPHLVEEAQLMEEEPSEYTGTPDPGRTAETPDLSDERPESSPTNQLADTGMNSNLIPWRCTHRHIIRSILACFIDLVIYSCLPKCSLSIQPYRCLPSLLWSRDLYEYLNMTVASHNTL